jgi:predicted kinase
MTGAMKFALRHASVALTMTAVSAPVLLMSGLPACGKTTMAERLSARLGAVLIRQCDVYAQLGIDLRAWVRRTDGFTRDVAAYERLRDDAYVAMRRAVDEACARTASAIVVDAVHGERAKRQALYAVCAAHGRRPAVVWCRCDDETEIRRRLTARVGRDAPEDEANDVSIVRHLASLWEAPVRERLPDGSPVEVAIYDSACERWTSLPSPHLARMLGAT